MKTSFTFRKQRVIFSLICAALFLGFSGLSMQSVAQGVITIKTKKKQGDKMNLRVIALGDFSVSGTEPGSNPYGDGWATYTLTGATVTITGKVQELNFVGVQATSLTLENCSDLVKLDCRQNELAEISFQNTNKIQEIYCDENALTELDLSNQERLNSLYCTGNKLKTLTLKGCPLLTLLYCYENELQSLDVTECPNLQIFSCSINQISELKLGKQEKLTSLSATVNRLKGDAMKSVMEALPDRNGEELSGVFGVYAGWDPNEQNHCTTEHVGIAQKKNWQVRQHDGEDWAPYPGEPTALEGIGQKTPELYVEPSTKVLYINDATPNSSVRVYSTEGDLMVEGKIDANGVARLRVDSLATGVYIVSVGGRTRKLLIQ